MSEQDLLLAECERALIDALAAYALLADMCMNDESLSYRLGWIERMDRHTMDLLDHLIAYRKGNTPEAQKTVRFAHTLTPVKGTEIE
jgi:hypothetical protein